MKQYIDLSNRVLNEGEWVEHTRSGKRKLTVINADLTYDVSDGTVPVLTTKEVAWRPAIAEFLGYLRGYTNAADFRRLGCNTWNANANDNPAWLANPFRKGQDDMGRCYGAQGRDWRTPEGGSVDQLRSIYESLLKREDNGRLILTFHNPGELDRACLPACMHTHTFSIVGDTLHLTSYQRSADLPLGVPFNMVQCAWFLLVMSKITRLKPGKVYHKLVNVHIYEDQVPIMFAEQVEREPRALPKMHINPFIQTLEDVETWVTPRDFALLNYNPHPKISYPFTV